MPADYTFIGGEGEVQIFLEITNLSGIIECDFDVRIILKNGLRASELCLFFTVCFAHVLPTVLIYLQYGLMILML